MSAVRAYVCVCVHVCMVCMYVCVCVCVYIYIYGMYCSANAERPYVYHWGVEYAGGVVRREFRSVFDVLRMFRNCYTHHTAES